METEKRRSPGLNIGSASIIMVFSVLCLTIFAVLTFVTSNSEYKLATKNCDALKTYYAADTSAVLIERDILELVDGKDVNSAMNAIASKQFQVPVSVSKVDGGCLITYSETMDENQRIDVALIYNGKTLTTEKWELCNFAEWNADNGVEVWDGEF